MIISGPIINRLSQKTFTDIKYIFFNISCFFIGFVSTALHGGFTFLTGLICWGSWADLIWHHNQVESEFYCVVFLNTFRDNVQLQTFMLPAIDWFGCITLNRLQQSCPHFRKNWNWRWESVVCLHYSKFDLLRTESHPQTRGGFWVIHLVVTCLSEPQPSFPINTEVVALSSIIPSWPP